MSEQQPCRIQCQQEQADKLGLAKALPSLDGFPELKRKLEIFIVSWSIREGIYGTIEDEKGDFRTFINKKSFKNRTERDFFEIFQRYLAPDLERYIIEIYFFHKQKDTNLYQPAIFVFVMMLAALRCSFVEELTVNQPVYAGAIVMTLIAIIIRGNEQKKLVKNIEITTERYNRDFRFSEIVNYQQFVGKDAPFRMIADFYAVIQSLYKDEQVAKIYLGNPHPEIQAEGAQMQRKNRISAQQIVKFAAAIEARLRTHATDGQFDETFDSFARLQTLEKETANEAQQLAELQEAMKEIDAMLAGFPESDRIVDSSTGKAQPRIIEEEFGIEEAGNEASEIIPLKVLKQE